jgi:transcriptional regulator with XRE-family HTH domain
MLTDLMLGDMLVRAITEKGITATELARRSGVSREIISMISTGKRKHFSRNCAPLIFIALEEAIPLMTLLGFEDSRAADGACPSAPVADRRTGTRKRTKKKPAKVGQTVPKQAKPNQPERRRYVRRADDRK